MRLKADLSLFVIAIIWGSAFVAQRVAGQLGSVYLFNGARYILAGLVVLPFVPRARRTLPGAARQGKCAPHVICLANHAGVANLPHGAAREQYKWMFIAGFLLFIAAAFQQAGMLHTTAGNAGFITSLYVVLVPVVLFLGWSERPHWLSIVAVALAGGGAFLLSTGGRFEVRTGDALELGGALFWALHVAVIGKFASRFESISFSVGQLLVCGGLNLILGVFIETPVFTWSLAGAALYTAVFSLGFCYTLQVWAQRHTSPADAALILSLESVFAVLAGWLLLNETLGAIQIAGCALIFIAVGMSQVKNWNSGKIDPTHLVEGR